MSAVPDDATLTYTQRSVAFPANPALDGETDSVNVSLDARGGGTHGEFVWRFVTFRGYHDTKAVQLTCFGDGLPCLFDPRVQQVVNRWRAMPDPDEMTPEELTAILREEGAVPSRYMTPVEAPSVPEPVAEVTLTKSRLTALLVEAGIDYSIHARGAADRTEYIAEYVLDVLRR